MPDWNVIIKLRPARVFSFVKFVLNFGPANIFNNVLTCQGIDFSSKFCYTIIVPREGTAQRSIGVMPGVAAVEIEVPIRRGGRTALV